VANEVAFHSNLYTLPLLRAIREVTARLAGSTEQLARGLRITEAADDPAALAMAEKLKARLVSKQQARRNASDGTSMVQLADDQLTALDAKLTRMRELAVQSSDTALNNTDRTALNTEFVALRADIDQIATKTEFNDIFLLDGSIASTAVNIQVGIDGTANDQIGVTIGSVTLTALGLTTSTVDTQANASAAVTALDSAIATVDTRQGSANAYKSRLEKATSYLSAAVEDDADAYDRMMAVDTEQVTAELVADSIRASGIAAVLAQVSMLPAHSLTLIQAAITAVPPRRR
jgi:flagellin